MATKSAAAGPSWMSWEVFFIIASPLFVLIVLPWPHRRPYQSPTFGLRDMFILMTIIAVGLGIIAAVRRAYF
jgi:hypothetical protein